MDTDHSRVGLGRGVNGGENRTSVIRSTINKTKLKQNKNMCNAHPLLTREVSN